MPVILSGAARRQPARCTLRSLAATLAASVVLLAGCTSSGQPFRASGLDAIIPGKTTFSQAVALLQAEPVDTYRYQDGAMTARWAQTYTWLNDALYWRRETWLVFDTQGVFVRQAERINTGRTGSADAAVASGAGSSPVPMAATAQAAAQTDAAAAPFGRLDAQSVAVPTTTYPVNRDTP